MLGAREGYEVGSFKATDCLDRRCWPTEPEAASIWGLPIITLVDVERFLFRAITGDDGIAAGSFKASFYGDVFSD